MIDCTVALGSNLLNCNKNWLHSYYKEEATHSCTGVFFTPRVEGMIICQLFRPPFPLIFFLQISSLKCILPHPYFRSKELNRKLRILDSWPGVNRKSTFFKVINIEVGVGRVDWLVTRLKAGQPEILGSIFDWGPPILTVEKLGYLSTGLKLAGRAADMSPQPGVQIKNPWNYNSTSSNAFISTSLIKPKTSCSVSANGSEWTDLFMPNAYLLCRCKLGRRSVHRFR